ncbi:MAG TPA: hypothetical protein VKB88_08780 [Bryobacteraceae bacterium]|nr:hypothetical protein [Bryobacteraceae bacterium]
MNSINRAVPVAILAAAFAACQKPAALPPGLFPETAAGGWRRTAVRDLPVSESPDPVPRTSVDRLAVATYEGPGKLEARVYALSSPEVGLDLAQRWRPSADTVFFYRGRYFVVVKWEQAERKALEAFVRQLEESLGPANARDSQSGRATTRELRDQPGRQRKPVEQRVARSPKL